MLTAADLASASLAAPSTASNESSSIAQTQDPVHAHLSAIATTALGNETPHGNPSTNNVLSSNSEPQQPSTANASETSVASESTAPVEVGVVYNLFGFMFCYSYSHPSQTIANLSITEINRLLSIPMRVVLVGDSGTGKSHPMHRHLNETFSGLSTVGVSFLTRTAIHPTLGIQCKLEIWDTAGQERYRSLSSMYLRRSRVVLVVFDITVERTLASCEEWLMDARCQSPMCFLILVANKVDLPINRRPPQIVTFGQS